MIRTQNKVPDYYIEKSRDFQVFCRILDFLFNSTKYNSESILRLTDTERAKNTVLPLIGNKFGIYDKDAYSMREMLDALPCALQNKGSLHSVLTIINSFLDSMDVFDYVTVYNAKNKASADEISSILNREVKQYSLIIILSSYPNLTNLRILDTYLKMIVPTGVFIDYSFGYSKKLLDKYAHKDFVMLYYTKDIYVNNLDNRTHQMVSTVFGRNDVRTIDDSVFDIPSLSPETKKFMIDRSVENAYLPNTVVAASAESSIQRNVSDEYWKLNVVGIGLVDYMIIQNDDTSEKTDLGVVDSMILEG